MTQVNGLNLSLRVPIVQDLPLPKLSQIRHVTPMCKSCEDLLPGHGLLSTLIEFGP